jgi:SAM-dependent methyltransferase
MPESEPSSYDRVPYRSLPFYQTHPDQLATVATLFGLTPPSIPECRLLELGCASGGNLIPMAIELPNARFVGVDLSARQVSEGQAIIDALRLDNVQVEHRSILEVGDDFGRFDYIVCHGVYSWVPSDVQAKILDISARRLAPNGVAYVSYNTNPGWHLRGMIRDMMLYHAEQFAGPDVRVRQARNLLEFLSRSVGDTEGAYGLLLKAELELLKDLPDSYLFHEHLEGFNEPLYFYQFVERAKAKGLRYLGEAEVSTMAPDNFPKEVASVIKALSPDVIHLEQYLDFVRNRTFRQTLLCHGQQSPDYSLPPIDFASCLFPRQQSRWPRHLMFAHRNQKSSSPQRAVQFPAVNLYSKLR